MLIAGPEWCYKEHLGHLKFTLNAINNKIFIYLLVILKTQIESKNFPLTQAREEMLYSMLKAYNFRIAVFLWINNIQNPHTNVKNLFYYDWKVNNSFLWSIMLQHITVNTKNNKKIIRSVLMSLSLKFYSILFIMCKRITNNKSWRIRWGLEIDCIL